MTDPILLDLPAQLLTARLLLRPPQAGDGPVLHEAVAESLPALREFLSSVPWVAEEPSVERSEVFCRNAHANFLARRDMPFLVFERQSHRLLGATGLHRPNWSLPKLEIGYWCRTSASGHGLAGEAVAALADYAFAHARVARLELITDEQNLRSRRIAERCGFRLEGVLVHDRRAPDGTLRNTCMYARTAGLP